MFAFAASSLEDLTQLIPEPAGFFDVTRYISFAVYEYDAHVSHEAVIFERMGALLLMRNGR